MEEKLVKCASCKKPVNIKDFGGLFTLKGIKGRFFIHNNKKCLEKWMLEVKPALEIGRYALGGKDEYRK